jgi:hypothetical protein
MSALPQKLTSLSTIWMSAMCQKQTFCAAVQNVVIRSRRRHDRVYVALKVGPKLDPVRGRWSAQQRRDKPYHARRSLDG